MASRDSFIHCPFLFFLFFFFLATTMALLSQPRRCLSNHRNIPRSSFSSFLFTASVQHRGAVLPFAVISQPPIKPLRCNSPPTPAFTIFPPHGSAKMHDLPSTLTWAKSNNQCVN
ncbi:hypothetical protein I7I48_08821 [Histoplasma ohiense]|nr:hypothetical protein I7I48_08821 [Histoplasma ohiense (nom. inval.)]